MAFNFKTFAAVGALIGSLALVVAVRMKKIRIILKSALSSGRNSRSLKLRRKWQKRSMVSMLSW
ncbi:methionine ABC transporter substrate-binding protein [Klebsiella variicola]|uniref:Methionine ABC transporter substrate-binding protein n=1 Tax=Klebsiella variicola TaxID=244366 RepID=A0A7H4MDU0_KLEVA|nr:methionine ABC transporter substrate-binding protein [Klebsiella variicola]